MQSTEALEQRIVDFIRRPDSGQAQFEALALDVFAHQYRYNVPYRRYCDQHGRTPGNVRTWREVPAIAAASFADVRMATFPPERARFVFESSGTTRSGGCASRHELENARLYDASLLAQFRRCVMPDRDRMPMLLFSPSYTEAPHSSLAYMLSKIFEHCASGGGFYISNGELEYPSAVQLLQDTTQPTLIFGAAFALLHFLDRCRAADLRFALPPGSRVVETGGFKGKVRALEQLEFYAMLSEFFGVPREFCISEYGMCELGSQWYDANLADHFAGRSPRFNVKLGPHWARHLVVDPLTAQALLGLSGLLQLFDLSNRGSVAAVLTSDLARDADEGFIFMGRAAGAPPKGCSLTLDAMLSQHA